MISWVFSINSAFIVIKVLLTMSGMHANPKILIFAASILGELCFVAVVSQLVGQVDHLVKRMLWNQATLTIEALRYHLIGCATLVAVSILLGERLASRFASGRIKNLFIKRVSFTCRRADLHFIFQETDKLSIILWWYILLGVLCSFYLFTSTEGAPPYGRSGLVFQLYHVNVSCVLPGGSLDLISDLVLLSSTGQSWYMRRELMIKCSKWRLACILIWCFKFLFKLSWFAAV